MPRPLEGKRILVVEDEYLAAWELAEWAEDQGCTVVGPAGNLSEAQSLADAEDLDAAILDVHLSNETTVEPLIRALRRRNIPFVLATGYEPGRLPPTLQGTPSVRKPIDKATLLQLLELAVNHG